MELAGVGHRELKRRRRIETPLRGIGVDRLRLAVLQDLPVRPLGVSLRRDEHRARRIVRMDHRRMDPFDAVGLQIRKLVGKRAAHFASAVGARHQFDLAPQRRPPGQRQETIGGDLLEIRLQREFVAHAGELPGSGHSRMEAGPAERRTRRHERRADIGILVGEGEVR